MHAITFETYGDADVIQNRELAAPTVAPDAVLVRIHATTVGAVDTIFRAGRDPFARLFTGPLRPRMRVLGSEFAGQVCAVGNGVTRFAVGDRVFGSTPEGVGAHAELVAVPQGAAIAAIPAGISYEQAAAVPGGALTALPFLRDVGGLRPGMRVLINGAAGSVGSAAVQLAKHLGATVTAVASARHQALLRELGADETIDYGQRDFALDRDRYDIIFDAVGKRSYGECRRALTARGVYLNPVLSVGILAQVVWTGLRAALPGGGRRARFSATGVRPLPQQAADLQRIADMLADGTLRPVIDRRFTFGQAAAAHRYVDGGHKTGSVLLLPSAATGAAPATA